MTKTQFLCEFEACVNILEEGLDLSECEDRMDNVFGPKRGK